MHPLFLRGLPLACLILTACASPVGGFGLPLDSTGSRETPLHFGLYVTPDPNHNPIDPPERFMGYHAALDFEILAGEEDREVPVYAICNGKVVVSEFAEGYGGVIVQYCIYKGQDITVLYGHLDQASMTKPGEEVRTGDRIAVLGAPRSTDSDGNRKHLHLGMHKGKQVSLLGYVQEESMLQDFIDPATVLGLRTRPWPSSASGTNIR